MLKIGSDYSREEWEKETRTDVVFGIQRDILHDKFAPELDYGDFFLGESRTSEIIYCAQAIIDDSFMGKLMGKKRIKVLGMISKEAYSRL